MNQWPETSESLILRIRDSQDAIAWSQFMAIYESVVYRLARRRGLQHADAEDLCQRVFMSVAKAVEHWEPQEDGPQFRNWLNRVARNEILNAITRGKPDRATGGSSAENVLLEIPYLVMQYSSGNNLQKRIDVDGPLDVKEILRVGMQTARGLRAQ